MRARTAMLSTVMALASSCGAPAPVEKADPHVELERLVQRSKALEAFTATYRAPLEQTIRITYVAPDRARYEITRANEVWHRVVWTLGNRAVMRDEDPNGRTFADVPITPELMIVAADAVADVVNRAFPAPDGASSFPDLGPGASINLEIRPDRNDPEHGDLDVLLSWSPHRVSILDWLLRASSMPMLRDDGNRIVGEDPATRLEVAISKANGLLECITTAGRRQVELVEWRDSADPSDFTIPAPPPGARDVSPDYQELLTASYFMVSDRCIELAAIEYKNREGIGDDELRRRLTSVYEEVLPKMLAETLAYYRVSAKRSDFDLTAELRRLKAAAGSDPDLQTIFEQQVARMREEWVDGSRKLVESLAWANSNEAADHDPTDALISEVRHQSMTEMFDRELSKPNLAYFDECVRAVREGK
jgi:hypothetical protein